MWSGGLQRPLSHQQELALSSGFSSLYLESQLPHRFTCTPASTMLALRQGVWGHSVKGLTRW